MVLRMVFLLTFMMSCASQKPSPYQKEKKKEGFRDETFEDLNVSTFKANSLTKKLKAQRYAEFRAIEICLETQNKHANMIDILDKSVQKNVLRTSGGGWGPNYGFGMYPYYSRYSSFGIGASYSRLATDSWSETLLFPVIQVFYTCSERIWRPDVILKEISSEHMKLLVKDLKGALQIVSIPETSPNTKSVEPGDIIIKANGRRIEKVYELIRLFHSPDTEVSVQVLREGEKVMTKLKSKDITEDVKRTEKEIIIYVCKDKKKDYQTTLQKRKLCN
jgi:PDZ domain